MSRLDEYAKLFEDLNKNKLRVGWFPSSQYPEDQGGGYVASVALTQEFGDPVQHIPPRPFIRPTIANEKGNYGRYIRKLVKQRGIGADDVLDSVGSLISADIQKTISLITSPPLAAMTIRLRQERGNNSVKPLNDTGYMIATLTHDVVKK